MHTRQDRKFGAIIGPIDRLTFAAGALGGLCLVGIFAFIFAEIVSRNLFGVSLPFSWDYAAYMMGACFFLAAGATLKSGGHVRVTAIHDYLPRRGVLLLDACATVVGLLIAGAMIFAIGDMAYLSFMRGSAASSVVRTPLWIPQGVMTIGAVIFALQMLAQLLGILGGKPLAGEAASEDQL
jgi:C4-dicarboxylate transporter, DctQ subunit